VKHCGFLQRIAGGVLTLYQSERKKRYKFVQAVILEVWRNEEGVGWGVQRRADASYARRMRECNLLLKFPETQRWKEEILSNR
jgi:hypothetical protein